MKNPSGEQSTLAPSAARSKNPVEPKLPPLSKMPETPEELFRALTLTAK